MPSLELNVTMPGLKLRTFATPQGRRYFSVSDALERGQFRINKKGIKAVMGLVGLIALGCAAVIMLEAMHLSGYAAGYEAGVAARTGGSALASIGLADATSVD